MDERDDENVDNSDQATPDEHPSIPHPEPMEEEPSELDTLRSLYSEAQKQIEELTSQINILRIYKFGVDRFSTDDEEFIAPSAECMSYVYAYSSQESRPSARNLPLIDEFFLFLVRIRLGLFVQDLAHRFNISISSVSRKVTTWANYLYFVLGNQPIWPSREAINFHMPDAFKELYPQTRVILDCTEIFVQTPSSLLLQSQLYSSYKSNTTLKGLVGIAPHGAVTFISALFTGSVSDKEITRCSGVLDLPERNDVVMADKGFDIDDLIEAKGAKLNIPPFLQNQSQFSVRDVQDTKTIAKLRIHVERAIRRIKEYHIFDSAVPLSMLGTVPQMYTVICLLTNFQGPLIKNSQK